MRIPRPLNRAVLTLIVSIAGACGYGPPEYSASVGDYHTPIDGHVTIAVRSFEVIRPPRGIYRLPDGGIPLGVDQGIEVNICEQQRGTFRQIAVLHVPVAASSGSSTPLILQWLDTAVRVWRAYTRGDTVIALPTGVHTGVANRDPLHQELHRIALPECESSLTALRRSNRMPDGTPITP